MVVAVLILGLGIGANATLFSVLHNVLLSPLPYPNSDRLAVIWNELGQGGAQSLPAVSAADYRDYPRMSELFEDFAAASGARAVGLSGILTGDGPPEKVDLSPVTANFFPLFGVRPAHGRHFAPEEEAFEGPKVAMLSHELWQRRFGGDPGLVGRSIEIDGLPRLGEISIDGRVLAFTAGTALLTAMVFGLIPALAGTRIDLATVLRSDARSGGARRQHRTRQLLMVGEIGLSMVLLIGVGLMIQSFAALRSVDPGFDPGGVLTFRIELPRGAYPESEHTSAFFDQLEERALALPGVTGFGTISQLPLSGSGPLQPYAYDEETARNWESVTADGRWLTPGYFQSMGIQLLAGRSFNAADWPRERSALVVVDEVVARRSWPGQPAVGQRLQIRPSSAENPYAEVIGVVEHVRAHDLSRSLWGQIYRHGWGGRGRTVTLKTASGPARLIRPIETLVGELDPQLPVIDPRPMSDYVAEASSQARFSLVLIASGLGTAASLLLTRYLQDLLFGVAPNDPATIAGAALLLAAVALATCYLPARRASRLEPAAVLREE